LGEYNFNRPTAGNQEAQVKPPEPQECVPEESPAALPPMDGAEIIFLALCSPQYGQIISSSGVLLVKTNSSNTFPQF
jgi:hypothetical protein